MLGWRRRAHCSFRVDQSPNHRVPNNSEGSITRNLPDMWLGNDFLCDLRTDIHDQCLSSGARVTQLHHPPAETRDKTTAEIKIGCNDAPWLEFGGTCSVETTVLIKARRQLSAISAIVTSSLAPSEAAPRKWASNLYIARACRSFVESNLK